jgi:hypothetical protein
VVFSNFLGGYLAVCSVAVLTLAAWLFVTRARLWWWGGRATGEIIRYTERMRSRVSRSPQHMPHVRFNDPSGTPRDFVSTTNANPAKWPIGTPVRVVFARADPRKAEIAVPLVFWRGPVGVLLFGLALLFAAIKVGG